MNVDKIDKNLIDVDAIGKVSEDIFTKLQTKKVDYSKTDLTKFTRQTLGVDLYSQKSDISLQRQIAITNSGVFDGEYAQSSIQALNSFAAQQLYADTVENSIGGKMTIDYVPSAIEYISTAEEQDNVSNISETDDKREFNPFYFSDFTTGAQNS